MTPRMNQTQAAAHKAAKDKFLADISKLTGWPVNAIVEVIRKAGLRYNPEKQDELRLKIEDLLREEKIQRLANDIKVFRQAIAPQPCWLAETPGIECKGVQLPAKRGMVVAIPRCSIGGSRHYLAWRSGAKDPAAFLKTVEQIDQEYQVREAETIKEYWRLRNA
jgi:hypothetical protein